MAAKTKRKRPLCCHTVLPSGAYTVEVLQYIVVLTPELLATTHITSLWRATKVVFGGVAGASQLDLGEAEIATGPAFQPLVHLKSKA